MQPAELCTFGSPRHRCTCYPRAILLCPYLTPPIHLPTRTINTPLILYLHSRRVDSHPLGDDGITQRGGGSRCIIVCVRSADVDEAKGQMEL